MGVTERRRREKVALRQEILDAARELFAKEGYESVSMRRIAEKIEYSPTTIYLYFQDKRELIEEICNQTFALLSKKLEKVAAGRGDPLEKLKAGLLAYVDFGTKHPDQYRLTFMTPYEPSEGKDITTGQGWQTFQHLVKAVTLCVEAGRFRETDAMAVSQALWTVVHGLTSVHITHGQCFPWVDRNRLVNLAIDSTVGGLLA
ncbi:Transcriptional regulator, TetR family [Candidatus Sulfopaludibacter sp. SbA6]|nr:Transcriptional regulator, TetR family [Candidatus Sulfopaludibacter sp. SbA6]